MTTNNKNLNAETLLRDMAFALRMARHISNEIRAEEETRRTYVPRSPMMVRLTDASPAVTLGA